MPARPVNQPTKVPIVSPVKGVVRSVSAEQQPPETCPNALNVLPYDLLGRKRVAQRFGISEFTSTTQTSQIQGLLPIGYVVQPGAAIGDLTTYTDSDFTPPIPGSITSIQTYSINVDFPKKNAVTTWNVQFAPYVNSPSVGGGPLVGFKTFFVLGNVAVIALNCAYQNDGYWEYFSGSGSQQLGQPVPESTFTTSTYQANFTITLSGAYYGQQTQMNAIVVGNGVSATYTNTGDELIPDLNPVEFSVSGLSGDSGNPFSTFATLKIT